jgi:hypothetical protein
MELLLNLIWLLLVVPALWVWRRRTCEPGGQVRRSQSCLLILGCILLLLFPVVSATDDLQAMRPEIEEAGMQDGIDHAHHGRFLASPGGLCETFALPMEPCLVRPQAAAWGMVAVNPLLPLPAKSAMVRVGRAPPLSFLG